MKNAQVASIGAALNVLGKILVGAWHNVIPLMFFNILWLMSCIPLLTIPPATAALYVITRELAQNRSAEWRDFFRVMKEYFLIGWRWGAMNLLAALIVSINVWFYNSWHTTGLGAGAVLAMLWWGIALVWIIVQMYCFPLLLEQQEPRVLKALRNAFMLSIRNPLFTLTFTFAAAFLIFLSLLFLPWWGILTVALLAFIYNRAVHYLIQKDQLRNRL